MPVQGIQAIQPEAAIRRDPGLDLGQRLRPQRIPASLRVLPNLDEPCLAQHPQMLGNRRLAGAEDLDQIAHGALPLAQQIEDRSSCEFRQGLERRFHASTFPQSYIPVKACTQVAVSPAARQNRRMEIRFVPVTVAHAHEVLTWRYDPPYDFYN